MDTNTLIVLGFLFLCILLSLDKKEGFATINISDFDDACNSDGTTCIINTSGSRGVNCSVPTDDIPYYNISGSNTHSESFDIQVNGCSDIGYQMDPAISPSVEPCQHSGENYILRGCDHKCSNPGSKTGYNLDSLDPRYQYISPLDSYGNPSTVVDMTEGARGSITCQEGYTLATDTCLNPIDGTVNSSSDQASCTSTGGIWYGTGEEMLVVSSTGSVETAGYANNIKIICLPGMVNYNIIGCKPGCISRLNDLGEYINSISDVNSAQPNGDTDKELIQILHRDSPLSNNTTLKYPITGADIYDITELDISTGLNWDVFGTGKETEFIDINGGNSTQINFSGVVIPSPCNSAGGKYNIKGLFPICDDDHECLNFNINYPDSGSAAMNINDFKTQMRENAADIGIVDVDIESYQNSLYYYRRYRDDSNNINIEGQIRCNNDIDSPFHCEITSGERTIILGQSTDGYMLNENSLCTLDTVNTDTTVFGDINNAISQCNDLGDSCNGFTFMNLEADYGGPLFLLHTNINGTESSGSSGDVNASFCYQKQ